MKVNAVIERRPEPVCGMNSWVPVPARILAIHQENFNTKTFTVEFTDEYLRSAYRFDPGQFNMIYVPGIGEAAISISSNPHQPAKLEHTIRLAAQRAKGRMGFVHHGGGLRRRSGGGVARHQ